MSHDDSNHRLHLVASDGKIVAGTDIRNQDLSPFPELPESADMLTPEIVQDFIAASRQHLEAGEEDAVIERLGAFPDKEFAANMAISFGERRQDQKFLELAKTLSPSEQVAEKVGRAALGIMLAKASTSLVESEASHGEMTTTNRTSSQTSESQSQEVLKDLDTEEAEGILNELKRLDQAVKSAKTYSDQALAKAEYDGQLVWYIEKAMSSGDLTLANKICQTAKTMHFQSQGKITFDEQLLTHIKSAVESGNMTLARKLFNKMKTMSGQSAARILLREHGA